MLTIDKLPVPLFMSHDKINYVPEGDWINIRTLQGYFKKILDGDIRPIELNKSPYITTSHNMEKKNLMYDIAINDGDKPYHVHSGTNIEAIKRALNTLPDMFTIKVTENRHISDIRYLITNDVIHVSIGENTTMLLPLTNENNKVVTYGTNKNGIEDICTVLDVLAWFDNGNTLSIRDGYVVIPEGFRGLNTSTGSVGITYNTREMSNHQMTLIVDGTPTYFHFTDTEGKTYYVRYDQLDHDQLLFQLGLSDVIVTRDMIDSEYTLPEPTSKDEALLYQWVKNMILQQPTENIPPLHLITL